METEEINIRFNEDLRRQIDGTLPKGHIYKLGNPGRILKEAGIPDLPIELNAKTLETKASPNYKNTHPFDLSEVKDLPWAIQNPIMVFDSRTRTGSKVIITRLKSRGINFMAAVETNHKKGSDRVGITKINSVRSVYPKDRVGAVLDWVGDGLLIYAYTNEAPKP